MRIVRKYEIPIKTEWQTESKAGAAILSRCPGAVQGLTGFWDVPGKRVPESVSPMIALAGYAVVARALSLAVELVPLAYKLFLTETLIEQLH